MALIKNDDDLIALTGVSSKLLDSLSEEVELRESRNSKRQFANSPKERILLCLCKLKLNLSFECLSILFNMTRKCCYKNFLLIIQLLADILQSSIVWPIPEQSQGSLSESSRHFPNVRLVLGCIEFRAQKVDCNTCHRMTYSQDKAYRIVRILIGSTVSGCICFVSMAYGGHFQYKHIFNQSCLLDALHPSKDAIILDKNFEIVSKCRQAHIKVITPPTLRRNSQISSEDMSYTNQVAAAKIPSERSIQRMKSFRILGQKISLPVLRRYADNICTVVAGLVNLSAQ
ncbi:hypothetical protein QAD02_004342 [Eretmocerus hayati]|uniref:Uncharacterized protein n=1 Tax=Eretmocerus hayati TaxID=131215 RepID=A0ACC2NQC3_9HYME|nr:hypothetical protein QAD02_004342 [Eretmocerus hayati]